MSNKTVLEWKPSNSPIWNDLLKVKEIYLKGRVFKVGNGRQVDFWRDGVEQFRWKRTFLSCLISATISLAQ
jgi:hypothetical protein